MNYIKATKEVMQEYNIDVSTVSVLSDGEVIKHFELCDPMWIQMKSDSRVSYLSCEDYMLFWLMSLKKIFRIFILHI